MKISIFFPFCLLLAACTGKAPDDSKNTEVVEIDSANDFYEQPEDKTVYDYKTFEGIYDHESTTRGFTAILTITESGNDLAFTLSVSQGTCKGEAQGKILMVAMKKIITLVSLSRINARCNSRLCYGKIKLM
jgi:hypothetical protein